ncbi:MAG: hypothetical protein HXY22_00110 [Alphaproteobacteria bacterium]|nr:hypothetical protein [Alphaproteobacteria bacterium]
MSKAKSPPPPPPLPFPSAEETAQVLLAPADAVLVAAARQLALAEAMMGEAARLTLDPRVYANTRDEARKSAADIMRATARLIEVVMRHRGETRHRIIIERRKGEENS